MWSTRMLLFVSWLLISIFPVLASFKYSPFHRLIIQSSDSCAVVSFLLNGACVNVWALVFWYIHAVNVWELDFDMYMSCVMSVFGMPIIESLKCKPDFIHPRAYFLPRLNISFEVFLWISNGIKILGKINIWLNRNELLLKIMRYIL